MFWNPDGKLSELFRESDQFQTVVFKIVMGYLTTPEQARQRTAARTASRTALRTALRTAVKVLLLPPIPQPNEKARGAHDCVFLLVPPPLACSTNVTHFLTDITVFADTPDSCFIVFDLIICNRFCHLLC